MQTQQQGLHPLYKSNDAQYYAIECSKCFSVKHFESSYFRPYFYFWPLVLKYQKQLILFLLHRVALSNTIPKSTVIMERVVLQNALIGNPAYSATLVEQMLRSISVRFRLFTTALISISDRFTNSIVRTSSQIVDVFRRFNGR